VRLRLAPFEHVSLGEALGLASAALRAAEQHREPVLVTSLVSGGGTVLGALQRREQFSAKAFVRLTTGPRALVVSRAFHHAFALPALTTLAADATPHNLLNRHVRGFLRGYSKLGPPAQYFGREYFCLGRRPFGLVGYDVTARGAVLFEVFAGLDAAALEPSSDSAERAVALAELVPHGDPQAFAASIHQGFAAKWQLEPLALALEPEALPSLRDAPGEYARRRVPIGWLEAAAALEHESASVRLAGDVLSSRAAVDAVESRAAAALLAGRDVDESVLAPLSEGPLDGATVADVQAVLTQAFRSARSAS
jgi:hypothetical protein